MLAQFHADANHVDTDGRTALDVAEEGGRHEAAVLIRRCSPAKTLPSRSLGASCSLGWMVAAASQPARTRLASTAGRACQQAAGRGSRGGRDHTQVQPCRPCVPLL